MIHVKAVALGSIMVALLVGAAAVLAIYPIAFAIIGFGGAAYLLGRAALTLTSYNR